MTKLKGFVFFSSWWEIIKQLDKEVRSEVLNAIAMYGVEGNLPELSPIAEMAMQFIKKDIDVSTEKYEEVCEKRREAINARWAKRQGNTNDTNVSDVIQSDTKNTNVDFVIHNKDKDKDKDKDNIIKEKTNNKLFVQKKEKKTDDLEERDSALVVTQEGASEEQTAIITLDAEKEKSSAKRERLLNRQKVFYQDLIPFVEEYGKEMIRRFYDFWSEPNKSQTQMRFELERTWDTKRRLAYWERREASFPQRGTPQQQPVSRLRENMAQMDRVAQILNKTS